MSDSARSVWNKLVVLYVYNCGRIATSGLDDSRERRGQFPNPLAYCTRRAGAVLLLALTASLAGIATPGGATLAQTAATVVSVTLTSDPDATGADDDTYAFGDVVAATVTFSEAVTVDDANGSPTLTLDIGDSPEQAAYASGSGTASLVFRYTVEEDDEAPDGIAIGADALALNDARITAGGTNAALTHDAVPANRDHKVDGVRPTLERLETSSGGRAIVLVYDEVLHATGPLYDHFTIKVDGTEVALNEETVAVTLHRSVVLTLAAPVARGQTVTLSYTDPTGGNDEAAIQDRAGNDAASLIDRTVTNTSTLVPLPVVTIEAVTETVSYNVGTGNPWDIAVFRLTRTGDTHRRLRVKLGWEELVTELGYTGEPTTFVVFRPGQSERIVKHLVIDTDGDNNPLTSITFELYTHDGYTLGEQHTAEVDVTVPGQQQTRSASDLPVLAVADARAKEGTDSAIAFAVTLDRPASGTVRVDYATSDGTADAGKDYVAKNGTLTFAPGDTEKTVSVKLLDDAHNDGEETLKLTLSNATGDARIGDAEAIGTIENSDPMPQAWLSRFGRAVAGHVVGAVGGRLSEAAGHDSQVTLGGRQLPLGPGAGRPAASRSLAGTDAVAAWNDVTRGSRGLSGRELLRGSSFRLSLGEDGNGAEGAGTRWTAWGEAASSRFDGRADGLALDGDATTVTLGADAAWERWLAGAAISLSEGTGGFRDHDGRGAGALESALTSIHPYLRYQASERLSLWGMLGVGTGELILDADGTGGWHTDTSMQMAAMGARGVLLPANAEGGLELALRTDALLLRMRSDAVTGDAGNLAESEADISRLRLILEGSRRFELTDGRTLTPSFEAGLRQDGGDAETGTGIVVGGGLSYGDPAAGVTLGANLRGLVAHEDADYAEWGASASLRVDPGTSGRGLSLTLAPGWGAPSGGTERLWSLGDAQALAASDGVDPAARLDAEAGYGFAAFAGRGTVTPYAGLRLSEAGEHTLRSGIRWAAGPALSFGLEGTRRAPADDGAVDHGIGVSASLRW